MFLKCHSYYCATIINCSCTKHQRQQLAAHNIYCERKCTKVLQTHASHSTCTFHVPWCYKCNWSIPQNKHHSNISNKNITNIIKQKYKKCKLFIKIHKLSINGSFFSHKKQCFQSICSTCNHY